MKEPWPMDRRKEMALLMDLLITASNLNSGSDFIGRLEDVMSLANKLNKSDINTARKSFVQFLVSEAAGK